MRSNIIGLPKQNPRETLISVDDKWKIQKGDMTA